mmetsp:Transcript_27754/g.65146  ORF Transcript_27754/g.65146 Transcript_27754/m.65146 type:complete len:198 (-) Transcript_27754:54-647(-)
MHTWSSVRALDSMSSLLSSLTPTQDDTNCDGSADDGKGPNIVLREQLILPTRTTSAGAVGSAGADIATRAGPLGLGWARGAVGRLAASSGAVSAAARITALAVLPASACGTGAALCTRTTAAAGTARAGLEFARFDGGNDGVISNRRAGDVGGAGSEADGGLDAGPEVLDGLGDGADAGAARHSGDADSDIRGGHDG